MKTLLHLRKTVSILAVAVASACATNPVTGKREVMLVSEGQEVSMGQQADPAVVAEFGLYEDKKLQRFVEQKGKQLAAVSHRPNLDYHFKVVDSPVINAFAIPGGYVYITRGIMAHFNNEAQFAGVIGHEIGHVAARHSAHQQSQQMLGQVALIGGMIASPRLAQYGEQAMQGMSLLFLKFSRDDEREADQTGVQYASAIGYDASEMADFFVTLQRESQKSSQGQTIPDFMSSHPNPGERYETVHQLAADWQKAHPGTKLAINRDQYLDLIDGIVYGEDPRQGFVETGAFFHPELKFQFPVPAGWATQNAPQQFQMMPKDGKALMMFTLAPGKTLQDAAQQFVSQMKLQVSDSRQTTINGFPAAVVQADQAGQQAAATVRTLTTFIQDGKNIYAFLGATSVTDFSTYGPVFLSSAQGFQRLTDPARLNRQPERIRVVKVKTTATLADALRANGVPDKRLEELAIVNGMQQTDRLLAGTRLKVLGK